MTGSLQTLEFKFERTITAPPQEVYDAWLDPKIPGNPWHESDKLILNPVVDGLFYWLIRGTPHFGRFTETARPYRLEHTWMSPSTLGLESTVTLTFKQAGEDTLLTLVHAGLPDHDLAKGHEKGWNYFLGIFPGQFGAGRSRRQS
jgi:uncharacterized protein YndB with AHSA1/START domain